MKTIWVAKTSDGLLTFAKSAPAEQDLIGMIRMQPGATPKFYQAPDGPTPTPLNGDQLREIAAMMDLLE